MVDFVCFRDHPEIIRLRFVSVTVVCLLALPIIWFFSSPSSSEKVSHHKTHLSLWLKEYLQSRVNNISILNDYDVSLTKIPYLFYLT